jgi:peptide/nickel transport system ATP-binding protein
VVDGELSHDAGPVLAVTDVSAEFHTPTVPIRAVRQVSFSVSRGEKVGIVGESGSGKSTLALTLLGLLEPPGYVTAGEVRLNGRELVLANDRQMSRVRGKEISLIYQDPMAALNPVKEIGAQVEEALRRHQPHLSRRAVRARAIELLRDVEIPDAARRFDDYPHQYSGGMRQRVLIAIALANDPDIVIADEPTTALDVTTQAQVLDLLERLVADRGAAVIFITHNFGIVADFCDSVYVMYAGRFVERASVTDIFACHTHPYTEALLRSVPRLGQLDSDRLFAIPGSPPDLRQLPPGCSFSPRCPIAQPICRTKEPVPGYLLQRNGRTIASECHFADQRLNSKAPIVSETGPRRDEQTRPDQPGSSARVALVEVDDLRKVFAQARGVPWRPRQDVHAVNGVSLSIRRGETFGLVGESGCGKSTLGRCLVRLLEPSEGRVLFDGRDITHVKPTQLRPLRREMQMVFQDPYTSLDPRMSVHSIVEEPLVIHGASNGTSRGRKVDDMLSLVGLPVQRSGLPPHAFSGGQRQRVAIARALILHPRFVVLDEPISALDVSVQAQILNLFTDLQDELGLTYLFITHDLVVGEFFCDRIAVLYMGEIMEMADRRELFDRPLHPYTVSLMSAIPAPDPAAARRSRIVLKGEVSSQGMRPPGCPFQPRCPVGQNREICRAQAPPLASMGPDHFVACHFAGELSLETATQSSVSRGEA